MATRLSNAQEGTAHLALPRPGAQEAVVVPAGPRNAYLALKVAADKPVRLAKLASAGADK